MCIFVARKECNVMKRVAIKLNNPKTWAGGLHKSELFITHTHTHTHTITLTII